MISRTCAPDGPVRRWCHIDILASAAHVRAAAAEAVDRLRVEIQHQPLHEIPLGISSSSEIASATSEEVQLTHVECEQHESQHLGGGLVRELVPGMIVLREDMEAGFLYVPFSGA